MKKNPNNSDTSSDAIDPSMLSSQAVPSSDL
jgi:hypothetical protein